MYYKHVLYKINKKHTKAIISTKTSSYINIFLPQYKQLHVIFMVFVTCSVSNCQSFSCMVINAMSRCHGFSLFVIAIIIIIVMMMMVIWKMIIIIIITITITIIIMIIIIMVIIVIIVIVVMRTTMIIK